MSTSPSIGQFKMKMLLLVCIGALVLDVTTTSDLNAASARAPQGTRADSAGGQNVSAWKTFRSRGGWSIKYPQSWIVWSCRSCADPTDPMVYVSFGQPPTSNGFVMIEPLADKPGALSIEQWIGEVKRSANQNPIMSEQHVTVSGLAALMVRYKNSVDNVEMEATYIVRGSKTYSIGFSAEAPGARLDDAPNYSAYQRMVLTFAFEKPANQAMKPSTAGRKVP